MFRFMVFVFVVTSGSGASAEPATVKVISDLKDSIVQKMGWKPEEVQISDMNSSDTMIGHATLYEFDLQIGNAILPLRLSEDVTSWQFMEDISANEDQQETTGSENSVVEHRQKITPVLAPFQLAGPLELWIQDADHMRLSVPHDVEAGILKKVMLADGAVVTVKGARELNLRQPLQLPLPLGSGTKDSNLASSLFALASKLRHASANDGKPLSLRIVGPSSLVASSISEPDSASNRLKVKRLAPGSVELISRQQQEISPVSIEASIDSLGHNDMWMWPLPSLNSSHPKLLGFDQLLREILGSLAQKEESFKLLKARASAASFVKVQFELERKLGSDMFSSDTWPEWRTKPSIARFQFELIAKLEGDKMLPVSLHQIKPVIPVETSSMSSVAGNVTMSEVPIVYIPPSPMTL